MAVKAKKVFKKPLTFQGESLFMVPKSRAKKLHNLIGMPTINNSHAPIPNDVSSLVLPDPYGPAGSASPGGGAVAMPPPQLIPNPPADNGDGMSHPPPLGIVNLPPTGIHVAPAPTPNPTPAPITTNSGSGISTAPSGGATGGGGIGLGNPGNVVPDSITSTNSGGTTVNNNPTVNIPLVTPLMNGLGQALNAITGPSGGGGGGGAADPATTPAKKSYWWILIIVGCGIIVYKKAKAK